MVYVGGRGGIPLKYKYCSLFIRFVDGRLSYNFEFIAPPPTPSLFACAPSTSRIFGTNRRSSVPPLRAGLHEWRARGHRGRRSRLLPRWHGGTCTGGLPASNHKDKINYNDRECFGREKKITDHIVLGPVCSRKANIE